MVERLCKGKSYQGLPGGVPEVEKALLMQTSLETAVTAQERDAYAHPEYLQLLAGLREAVEQEESLRWKLIAAQAKIEVWRTESVNARAIDRAIG